MNAKLVNSAAGVILAALQQNRVPAGIATALDSAGLLMSPDTAAELERLRTQRDNWKASFEAERQSRNEELGQHNVDVRALRARVAELEQQREADHKTWQHDLRTARVESEAATARVGELEEQVRLLNTQRGDVAQLVVRERSEGEECVDIDDVVAALSLGSDESAEAGPEERLLGEDELKGAVRGHLFGGGR